MPTIPRRSTERLFLFLFLLGAFLPACRKGGGKTARFRETLSISGPGARFDREGHLEVMIRSDRRRIEADIPLPWMSLEEAGILLLRLDKGVMWLLSPSRRTFVEKEIPIPTDAARKERERPDLSITRSEIEVTKAGLQRTIEGFDCERYDLVWRIDAAKGENRLSGTLSGEIWTTPKQGIIAGISDIEDAFLVTYLKQIGIASSPLFKYLPDAMLQFLLREGLKQVAASEKNRLFTSGAESLRKLEGYPIHLAFRWESNGEFLRETVERKIEEKRQERARPTRRRGRGGARREAVKEEVARKAKARIARGGMSIRFTISRGGFALQENTDPLFEIPAGFQPRKGH